MNLKVSKIIKISTLAAFIACIVVLLIIDRAILLAGQIGFVTVIIYYAVFIVLGAIYWIAALMPSTGKPKSYELILTIVFAIAPLTLAHYGYGGPV